MSELGGHRWAMLMAFGRGLVVAGEELVRQAEASGWVQPRPVEEQARAQAPGLFDPTERPDAGR